MPILVGEVRLTKPPTALLTTPCGRTKARLVPGRNPLAKSGLLFALPACRHKELFSLGAIEEGVELVRERMVTQLAQCRGFDLADALAGKREVRERE
jgi:hypothetical protein